MTEKERIQIAVLKQKQEEMSNLLHQLLESQESIDDRLIEHEKKDIELHTRIETTIKICTGIIVLVFPLITAALIKVLI